MARTRQGRVKRDTRQGCYILLAGRRIYVGSTAGGKGRGFDARKDEHLKQLAAGTHHNDKLQAQFKRDGGKDWRMIKIPLGRGDIPTVRLVESAIIRAMGKAVCNERR